jgi:hypothetical protein
MMGKKRFYSMTDQELQALLRETLPLQDALVIGMIPSTPLGAQLFAEIQPKVTSVVWINTAKRPDFRDLGRVHATEGEGTVIFTWTYIDETCTESIFVLAVEMLRPVQTSFSIAIPLPEYAALIEIVSWTGSLSLVSGPPIEWRQLIHQIPLESLMEKIHQQGGHDTTLTMGKETITELRSHFETWKKHQARSRKSGQP